MYILIIILIIIIIIIIIISIIIIIIIIIMIIIIFVIMIGHDSSTYVYLLFMQLFIMKGLKCDATHSILFHRGIKYFLYDNNNYCYYYY